MSESAPPRQSPLLPSADSIDDASARPQAGKGRLLVLPGWVDEADEAVDRAWDALRGHPAIDRVFYGASAAGDFSALWHACNLARLVTASWTPAQFVRVAAALGAESVLVNQGIKRLFRRARPVPNDDRPFHLRSPSTSSFPSGHASSAVVAASLLSTNTRYKPLYVSAAVVVATSRIHVRIHHASDVVAGAAVGAVGVALWRRLWPSP